MADGKGHEERDGLGLALLGHQAHGDGRGEEDEKHGNQAEQGTHAGLAHEEELLKKEPAGKQQKHREHDVGDG